MKSFSRLLAGKSSRSRVVYYASHHSYTHVRSALALSRLLSEVDFYLITPERFTLPVPKNVRVIFVTQPNCAVRLNDRIHLHRYPYVQEEPDIVSHRKHITEVLRHIDEIKPNLVVVDLLAEIALLIKYLGYPVAFFYETIDNAQRRIQTAWDSVDMILTRYSESFVAAVEGRTHPKMVFGGGVSRYDFKPELLAKAREQYRSELSIEANEKTLTFISGSKTYATDEATQYYQAIFEAMVRVAATHSYVIYPEEDSIIATARSKYPSIHFIINPEEPLPYLRAADAVIAGGGMGVVMESCMANTPLVTIPVPWIFDEQNRKAIALQKIGVARLLDPRTTTSDDIVRELEEILASPELAEAMKKQQTNLIDGQGYRRLAGFVADLLKTEACQKGVSIQEK